MLHGVDRHRHDLHRPPLARPHQGHRDGHGVVDQHVLAHGDVELVGDEGVDQMPGQGRIARNRARDRDAPALVLVAVFARRADREGRQLVEKEVEAMVVVEDHRHVRLLAREPVMHVVEALEERLPVGIVLLLLRDRLADRGNVGRCNAADDPGHGRCPLVSRFRNSQPRAAPLMRMIPRAVLDLTALNDLAAATAGPSNPPPRRRRASP